VKKTDGGFFQMICEAKGNLRQRAKATTALATTALVAGGYLVISGTIAIAVEDVSVNEARKKDKLIVAAPSGASTSSNAAGKEGNLAEPAASNNAAAKDGKLIQAGAGESRKEGKLIPAVRGGAAADQADEQYVEAFSERKTADSTTDPSADDPRRGTTSNLDEKGDLFRPGPQYDKNYDAKGNVDVYGNKSNVATARPILEVGREQYTSGDYKDESSIFGQKNLLIPGLSIYGDWRTAVAYNQNNGNDIAQIATRVNIDVDLKLTGTERIHAFFQPIQDNGRFTRFEFGGGGGGDDFFEEIDLNPQTLFFEGDVGSIYSGVSGNEASFDLPFTVGLFPLFLQNGIWANDAVLGGAVSLTAKNSQKLGLSNYDITFFAAFDNVDNFNLLGNGNLDANANNNANLYGVTAFIDALGGYIETGYGLVQGKDDLVDGDLTHFLTAAYTKRYYNTLSNSTRVFANFGDGEQDEGLVIISENSLISGLPSTLLPYANFFVGFENPQPLVDGNGAGILKNVGINFETDALTGFPKLNDTGSNAFGGAIGIQYLFNLDQQIVFEVASVQPFGNPILGVGAVEPQYAAGVRYQIPLNKDWLFRADATYQIKEEQEDDDFGIRAEFRRKF
jgi:hypothetical protein